ncbi:MAG: YciI family protein [Tetrasphaera sp.]
MKYVILIHSNPQPWGHPTSDFNAEYQKLSPQERERGGAAFEALLTQMQDASELVSAEALGDPAAATLYRWDGGVVASDGPYAETKEHFAGYFLIDVASRERAEEIAAAFACPGDIIELRPTMWPGGDDA